MSNCEPDVGLYMRVQERDTQRFRIVYAANSCASCQLTGLVRALPSLHYRSQLSMACLDVHHGLAVNPSAADETQ